MGPDDLQCSRNARPQKALVGHAQYKINQPPSLERTSKLGRTIVVAHCGLVWEKARLGAPGLGG
jgi:hypothetical protein